MATKKTKKLVLGSFERKGEPGSFGHYFTTRLENGNELCLEACMGGYCVALYDDKQNIIGEKECTNIEGMLESQIAPGFSMGTGPALEKALKIANKIISK